MMPCHFALLMLSSPADAAALIFSLIAVFAAAAAAIDIDYLPFFADFI